MAHMAHGDLTNGDPRQDSAGGMLKTFMPNFVMIDFAAAAGARRSTT